MTIDMFLKSEKENDLYRKEIEGIPYWLYGRNAIYQQHIIAKKAMFRSMTKPSTFRNKVKKVFKIMFYASVGRGKLKRNIDVCFVDFSRKEKRGDYYYSQYIEDIRQQFSNSITLEMPYNHHFYAPIADKKIYSLYGIYMIGKMYQLFHQRLRTNYYQKIKSEIKNQVEAPLTKIAMDYQVDLDAESIYNMLVSGFFRAKAETKQYRLLLKKLNPKVIVEVMAIPRGNMIINAIAKELGIPTMELQHGMVNISYQYADTASVQHLPDKLLLFSDYWKQFIRLPMDEKNVISVGLPRFERELVRDKAMKTDVHVASGKKVILFISQVPIGVKMSKLAVDVYKQMSDRYDIIYKLHPNEYTEWQKKYPWLAEIKEMTVIANDEISIYACFAKSDIQVGGYSTGIFEGLGFNLATYLIPYGHTFIFEPLVGLNYAKWVHNSQELCYYLSSESLFGQDDVSAYFWKKNALQNIEREIVRFL
ncbi:MAG: CDP-glycerol glycerophosphotransferase family protein [Lachnospiraceae bacterium]|nr:CDP-glycerol glycerophosphotransferase family protein [Lachnospiraceae bacterium]